MTCLLKKKWLLINYKNLPLGGNKKYLKKQKKLSFKSNHNNLFNIQIQMKVQITI